ncbi:MAG: M20/M25/M40 family metallo-hydrolase [SAR202 cluster bacterium]|nr:M20/M25/M40 family metallo-hydrolase [SAR202 cluster bacterium]|tara:strand:- start:7428 stop:8786 length:1359 start_codon:yes stop_codon:yes gene_type:complete
MTELSDLLDQVENISQDIIKLEQDLVRINTTNTGFMPTGNETEVCKYLEQLLSKEGIASETVESDEGRGNFIARLDGATGQNGLLFMSHSDVVPVEDYSKWRFDPFSATIYNGRIFGRGASDCKGLLTAQIMAMILLKRNGIRLNDSLLLVSGADEEHGGRYGFGWLAANHPDKLNAPVAVNEGGGIPIKVGEGFVYSLGVGEKGRLQVEIDINGKSAHASQPWRGDNVFYGLAEVVSRIEAYEAERDTSSSIFNYMSNLAIEHIPTPENIDNIINELEEDNNQLYSLLKALSRMTLTPTMVNGGIKSNSVPESVRLTCDVRTLPNQDEDYLKTELDKVLEGIPGVQYSIDYMAVPNSSDFETKFADEIRVATSAALGMDSVDFVPTVSTGFTDSRFTRDLGIVTYGFMSSHPNDDVSLTNAHGIDESIGIDSLINCTKTMLALAYNMLSIR